MQSCWRDSMCLVEFGSGVLEKRRRGCTTSPFWVFDGGDLFGVAFCAGLGFDLRDRRTRAGGGEGTAVGGSISSSAGGVSLAALALALLLGWALALAAVARLFFWRDAATSSGDALAETQKNDLSHTLKGIGPTNTYKRNIMNIIAINSSCLLGLLVTLSMSLGWLIWGKSRNSSPPISHTNIETYGSNVQLDQDASWLDFEPPPGAFFLRAAICRSYSSQVPKKLYGVSHQEKQTLVYWQVHKMSMWQLGPVLNLFLKLLILLRLFLHF